MRTWMLILLLCLMLCGFTTLVAQNISNIRISQDAELGYYKITFDLEGKAEDMYLIKAVPYKTGTEITQPRFLSGDGIGTPCSPGKGLCILWNPALEGVDKDNWQVRLSALSIARNMVLVEGGSFMMGSSDSQRDEKPVHQVTVSSFYIGKYEVSQIEWQEVMGSNPSKRKGERLPVEQVSWYDAVTYCNKLSLKEGLQPCYSGSGASITCDWTANGYRLPTEAEWEYAARGGKQSKGYKYAGANDIGAVAWYNGNSSNRTHEVGTKSLNELGIYDMSGNVWEWCWDWYSDSFYGSSPGTNPKGAGSGGYRLFRGGSWSYNAASCRVSYRYYSNPYDGYSSCGFRLCRAAQ